MAQGGGRGRVGTSTRSAATIVAAAGLLLAGCTVDASGRPAAGPARSGTSTPAEAPSDDLRETDVGGPADAVASGVDARMVTWGYRVHDRVADLVDLVEDADADRGPDEVLRLVITLEQVQVLVTQLAGHPCPDPGVDAPYTRALTRMEAGIDTHRAGYDAHQAALQRSSGAADADVVAARRAMDDGLASFDAGVVDLGAALAAWRTARGID